MKHNFLLLLLAARVFAAQPFFFIQMSDPQFGMQTDNRDFAQETASFEFAIATANRLKPAFVVITGDLVNKPGDPAQIAEFKRIAAKLNPSIKLYNVAGNHDVGNEPTPESLAAYRKNIGPDYYAFRSAGLLGIVLNASLIQHPDKAPGEYEKQLAWLRAELERARRERVRWIVLFQHQPWFLQSPDEPDQYFNIPLARRTLYLDLLHRYGVRYVFAGHYHRNAESRDGPLEMITTGPVGKPLDDARSGMRIAIVSDAGIRHAYFDFGILPNRVEAR
ncbi:MAG TPA: metallophosphoesterase [Bryobacteraceae bacterium]|nr:metallophosphoesterase [Bryobacteraceae bacterium]